MFVFYMRLIYEKGLTAMDIEIQLLFEYIIKKAIRAIYNRIYIIVA